ncbi:trypsin-like peptidase domain-containing protein [Jatrophihabitans sp. YIM 134969]
MDRDAPQDPQQSLQPDDGSRPSTPAPPDGHTSPVPPSSAGWSAPAPGSRPAIGSIWTPPPAAPYDWSQQGHPAGSAYPPPPAYPPPTWTAPTQAVPAAVAPKRRTGRVLVAGAAALALIGAGVGIGAAVDPGTSTPSAAGATAAPNSDTRPDRQFPGFGSGVTPGEGGDGTNGSDGVPGGTDGTGSDGGSTGTSNSVKSDATDAQSRGVVVIDTVLGYQNAQAAGTGMIIGSDGTVLTNNHVVEGSTSIRVTVISTGRTYNATVVGTDASDDVAVIKLTGASGLATVTTDTTSNIAAGTSVVAVGNAGGTGSLTAATGTVTATGQSITATDEDGANAEQLQGLLQTNAAIEAGDSGGPLYDAQGEVVGINTAAATTSSGATAAGYAIPIGDALTIAQQIVSGTASDTVTIGLPAFLGVSLAQQQTGDGATVAGVVDGLPAAGAGLVAGDTITAIDGTRIGSADDLSAAMAKLAPGDSVSLTWTTAAGQSQSATVTLVEGPAA